MTDRRRYRRERRQAGLETYASLGAEQKAKAAVRGAVSWALWHGKLERQPCEVCGATGSVEAHHEDYAKPLDVEWLCPTHHRERESARQVLRSCPNCKGPSQCSLAVGCATEQDAN